jgi:hypothetical protein
MHDALWWFLFFESPLIGIPLIAVGAILWLCERIWHKPFGSMGSLWHLGIGGLLSLPFLIYIALAFV